MASHHQVSPSAAMHQHHSHQYAPQHAQPNGHPPQFQNQPPQPQPQPHHPRPLDQLTKNNEEIWVSLGRCAEALGSPRIAIESYNRALQFNQYNVDALRNIAGVYRAEDKYDQAVEYIKNILKLCPTDGEAFSSLGHCYLMMDELQQAYSAYQSALYNLRDPKEPKLWYGIGILYDRYGSLDHAEEAFSQVMRMQPDFEKANEIYFRLGIIYKQQLKFVESLQCFEYIVNNPPKPLSQTDIWFQIGHVYEQQKNYDSAKNAYLKVLERDPQHAKVLQQLGWLHHQQSTDYSSQEQAIEYLEKSVSADQTDAQSWYLLGRCYMSQHKFPKAYEAYQQAVYREGRNPTFWCSIGVLYYQINQYRDALDAYSRAIRLNPNISEVWYDLGTLYESCNNQTSDALDAYQRAADLDPNNQQIKARVQLLRSGQSSGAGTQHSAPLPQDVPPQAYQPTGAGGPAQTPWGVPAPHSAPHHQGPPPPPLNAARDWNQRPGDPHGAPPQSHQQPPNSYEARESSRMHHNSRPISPRPPEPRHQDSYGQNSMRRPLSPSPRSRNTLPNTRGGQNSTPAPVPPQQQTPSNRISNPNFGSQHAPPTPTSAHQSTNSHQAQLPSYSRVVSPPNEHRHAPQDRPRSPRAGYGQHHQQSAYSHHQEPTSQSNIASGAPAPPSAHAQAEHTARERDDRSNGQAFPQKRPREWEDREESSSNHKKMASDESRARLDEPNTAHTGPPLPAFMPLDREREERERMQSTTLPSASTVIQATKPSTPGHDAKAEEEKRANENYRPSEVAHHPAPLRTVMQQEPQATQEASKEQATLPPMRTSVPTDVNENGVTKPKSEPDPEPETTKMEVDEAPRASAAPVERPEEPAARKMDVDENYDDDSSEETKNAGAKGSAGHSGNASREGSQRAGETSIAPTSSNGVSAEAARVETSA